MSPIFSCQGFALRTFVKRKIQKAQEFVAVVLFTPCTSSVRLWKRVEIVARGAPHAQGEKKGVETLGTALGKEESSHVRLSEVNAQATSCAHQINCRLSSSATKKRWWGRKMTKTGKLDSPRRICGQECLSFAVVEARCDNFRSTLLFFPLPLNNSNRWVFRCCCCCFQMSRLGAQLCKQWETLGRRQASKPAKRKNSVLLKASTRTETKLPSTS